MEVNQQKLYKALQKIDKVLDYKSSLVILSYVRLVTKEGKLWVIGTDMNQWLIAKIKCKGEIDVCLPCKTLMKMVAIAFNKSTVEKVVEFKSDFEKAAKENEPDVPVVYFWVDGVKIKLSTLDNDLFPDLPQQDWRGFKTLNADDVRSALAYVLIAMSRDEMRPHICSIFSDRKLLVSTDGHRLHCSKLEEKMFDNTTEDGISMSAACAITIHNIIKDYTLVKIGRSDSHILAKSGMFTYMVKRSEETFPPYDQIIPNPDFHVVLNASSLLKSLRKLKTLARTTSQIGIKVAISDVLSIRLDDPKKGNASVVLDMNVCEKDFSKEEEDFEFGVCIDYLIEAVSKKEDIVDFGFCGPLDPILITNDDDTKAVVMPMRI